MNAVIPRPEHPRPDLERNDWLNLNGQWEFEFDDGEVGETEKWYKGKSFSRKIVVPFCFQSEASGINDKGMHEVLWYRRGFELPSGFSGKRVFLNFGAVDYLAKVWINGEYAGSHKGGNVPFKLDITNLMSNGANSITVRAEDRYATDQPRGKQYWRQKPDRCWYTATSGIWQTVWLEAVGEVCIDKVRLTPDIDKRQVVAEIFLDGKRPMLQASITLSYKGVSRRKVGSSKLVDLGIEPPVPKKYVFDIDSVVTRFTINIAEIDNVDELHYWTPENPNLYDVEFELLQQGKRFDSVKSYFGMRKISVKGDMVLLNNRPYYQKLVLDQGYWPESLLTPPDDAAIILDIEMTKKMGFNGARKHQKIEDPRYYYWADRLGLLVWGEMPSAYSFNVNEIENITEEWKAFVNRDYNHPCIVTWVPLNESWGVRNIYSDKTQQNFARSLYYLTKALDSTRLVSTNDGWELLEADIVGIHDYSPWGESLAPKYKDISKLLEGSAAGRMLYCEGSNYRGEPVLITEYGGIAFETEDKESWGYHGTVKDEEAFLKRYESVTDAIRNMPYVRGYCYTQLTDVMQEVNGLMTAGRKLKVAVEAINKINR